MPEHCTPTAPCPVCEDVTWMHACGESAAGMAERTGRSLAALEKFLRRHQHPAAAAVYRELKRRRTAVAS